MALPSEFIFQMVGTEKILPSGKTILQKTWLSFFPDAKIGVIGHNGAGKSTLLKIMAKVDDAYQGECIWQPNKRIGYLPQEPQLDPALNVRENIELGLKDIRAVLDEFDQVSEAFGEVTDDDEMDKLIERQAVLQDQIDAVDGWELDRRVEIAMDALRVPDPEASVEHLSGGEIRRTALCQLLLSRPDMLILDEPTNHLDAESVAWLQRFLHEFPGCVVCVTHDRYFLDEACQWILELEGGKAIPYEGNYTGWLEQKQERLRQKKKSETRRAKTLAQELEWVRSSPKARQTKSKARITAYEDLLAQETSNERQDAKIQIPLTKRLGNEVLKVEGLSKGFGDRLLIDDLSFELPRGGIVGVIGPNGAGKTTMFRMIVGQDSPDTGSLTLGETVDLAYVDQSRDALNDAATVWEEISEGAEIVRIGRRELNSRAYVGAFNFTGAVQQQKVGTLSGGERNRVHLAKLLKRGGNVILLDEPTNDLDVETLRSLEEALLAFPGCVVVISHDRWFLDRIATHILAFEGDSHVEWFEGNYQAYERDRKRRMGEAADQPTRIRYKRLDR